VGHKDIANAFVALWTVISGPQEYVECLCGPLECNWWSTRIWRMSLWPFGV